MTAAKPALALLPGLLCDETVWRAQVQFFSGRAEVIVADYGDADSISLMAERALNAAPDRFALVGHSMGARVALEVLRMAPEKVESLALLDTGVHSVQPSEHEKRQRLVDLARDEGMEALCDAWLPPMVHPKFREDNAFMRPLREMVTRFAPDIFAGQIRALLTRPDTAPALDAINCPVLIGVGRQDEWSPVRQHEDILARIGGNAKMIVFDEAGHMAPYEAPQSVNAALSEWFSGAPMETGR